MNELTGRVAVSRAGRDKGKAFVITDVVDGAYALLVDGECRKVSAPKKKKLMHVFVTPHRADEIAQALSAGGKPLDSDFRKALAALGYRNRQE